MNENKKAEFNLENYKILSFSFRDTENNAENISVEFEPSGEYLVTEGLFKLTFEFRAIIKGDQEPFIKVNTIANFKFEPNTMFDDIPSYFYRNAIAIIFPYLRAFVSTLTVIGNTKPLILPVLNLTGLEQPFKDNSKVITQ